MSRATTLRTLAVSVAAAAAVAVSAAPAAACSPPFPFDPDYDPFAEADIAITGRVTKVRPRPGNDGGMSYEATIRVSRVYKGKTGPALRVRSTTETGACGFGELRVGQRLGLLLDGKRSPFSIGDGDEIDKSVLEELTGGRSHRPGRR